MFTFELNAGRWHLRVGSADPAVRARKHEVVSCSVADPFPRIRRSNCSREVPARSTGRQSPTRIVREALEDGKEHVFASPLGDQPINRKVMATALRGTKQKGKVKKPGICALLGLQPFTPHDLRRSSATLAGDLGFDDAWIAKCLDHAASEKSEQAVPSVTGRVYVHSRRMREKRAVLDGVAAELRGSSASPKRPPLIGLSCGSRPDQLRTGCCLTHTRKTAACAALFFSGGRPVDLLKASSRRWPRPRRRPGKAPQPHRAGVSLVGGGRACSRPDMHDDPKSFPG